MAHDSLTAVLTEASERSVRIRVIAETWSGQQHVVCGYVRHIGGPPGDPHVVLATRKNKWGGLDGWRYANLGRILEVTESAKMRRSGAFRTLWARNPLVVTSDGELDMSQSLKKLLCLA